MEVIRTISFYAEAKSVPFLLKSAKAKFSDVELKEACLKYADEKFYNKLVGDLVGISDK